MPGCTFRKFSFSVQVKDWCTVFASILQIVVNTIWLFLNNPECVLSKRSTEKFATDIATGNINA